MLQNILVFLNQFVGKAGKGNQKHSPLKDQSNQQGRNSSNRRLIQNHWQTSHTLQTTDQGYMQRNQDLWSQFWILQEPVEPLLPLLRSCLQGETSGQSGFRKPAIGTPGSAKQDQQGMSQQGNIFEDRYTNDSAIKEQESQKFAKQIILDDTFQVRGVTRPPHASLRGRLKSIGCCSIHVLFTMDFLNQGTHKRFSI